MAETKVKALTVAGLSVELGGVTVLKSIDLEVEQGAFAVLLGPNGSGKTTLLRSLYRAIPRRTGTIEVEGTNIDTLDQRALGRRVAVLRQEGDLAFDFLVEELVLMGRSPFKSLFDPDRPEDFALVDRVLRLTDTKHLEGRSFRTLSGGEKQRVLLARALAQQPTLLLLDEPTNHLDIRHQLEVLQCVRELGVTVLAALHDLNLAETFATEVMLLVEGELRASGAPEEVLTEEQIGSAFGVRAERLSHDKGSVLAFSVQERSE